MLRMGLFGVRENGGYIMLANLCVGLLTLIAFGSFALYSVWYFRSDSEGHWIHRK